MASNRALIGKTYTGETCVMTAASIAAYADATSDPNPRYRGEDAIAPPLSAVIFALKTAALPVTDAALIGDLSRVLKLLHGEQDIRWHRVMRPGDRLTTSATVTSIEEQACGELLEITTNTRDASGAPVVDMTWGFFLRGRGSREAIREARRKKNEAEAAAPAPLATPSGFELAWTVAMDQPARYAEASGDRNPIHVDENVAKMAGLRGVILHGMATMAFAQRAVVDRCLDGDPSRLRRMRVRFTKPVYPGATITARGKEIEHPTGSWSSVARIAFDVRDHAGATILKDGLAEAA
jgi:acyl dehydratase